MAAGIVQSVTPASYDPTLDFKTDIEILRLALDGNVAAANRIGREGADFIVAVRQEDSAEAGLLAIDLTARGVTFPAGTLRTIYVEAYCTGNTAATETLHVVKSQTFVGGTTPISAIDVNVSTDVVTTNGAGAVSGFTTTDPSVQFAIATNNVTITVTNEGAAEINNWILRIKVGKLIPVKLGV